MGIRFACCFCNLEDSQHLEMLSVVVHTIVGGFLSWMNLFETVLETFEIVSKGFMRWFFACDSLNLCICSSKGR